MEYEYYSAVRRTSLEPTPGRGEEARRARSSFFSDFPSNSMAHIPNFAKETGPRKVIKPWLANNIQGASQRG